MTKREKYQKLQAELSEIAVKKLDLAIAEAELHVKELKIQKESLLLN